MGLTSAGTAYAGPGLVYSGAFSFAPLLVLEKTLTLSAALFTAARELSAQVACSCSTTHQTRARATSGLYYPCHGIA